MPKVSICIPTYRQVRYLERTFQSIKAQDFDDFEVVITDDSPDDGVERLVAAYKDARWDYHRNVDRLGSPENWNAAVSRSSGELVKIMHHDDRFSRPDSLRRFVAMLDASPGADLAFSATTVENVVSKRLFAHRASEEQRRELTEHPWILFAGNIVGVPSATIYRRRAALEYDRRYVWLVDLEYYYRMLCANPLFAFDELELIVSSHNADHQVTQAVQDNADLVIGEHLMLLEDLPPVARSDERVIATWHALIHRHSMKTVQEFAERFPSAEARLDYFAMIFESRPSHLKVFSRRAIAAARRRAAALLRHALPSRHQDN